MFPSSTTQFPTPMAASFQSHEIVYCVSTKIHPEPSAVRHNDLRPNSEPNLVTPFAQTVLNAIFLDV